MGRTLRLGLIAAMLTAGVLQGVQASPVTLINGTTQIDVYGGEANNGLVPYGGYIR